MKKISLLLIALFIFSAGLNFVGCGSSPTTNPAVPTPTPGPVVLCGSPSSQGVTVIGPGGSSSGGGNLYAQPITLAAAETATSISAYVGSGPVTGQIHFAIYNDNANYPGNLVIDTTPKNVVASSWNTASIPNVYLPSTGTTVYWLAVQMSNTNVIPYLATGPYLRFVYGWATMPDTFPASAAALTGQDSLYITTCP